MGRRAPKNRLPQGRSRERRESAPRPIVGQRVSSLRPRSRFAIFAVCSLLLLAIITVYGQTARHDFVNFDDDEYVRENWHVLQGLNGGSIAWAFTHRVSAQWTPLTLLSLMCDVQLVQSTAGRSDTARLAAVMHVVNAGLHAVNALLLFAVLRAMTGALWPCAFVAAVFAAHPLHVESVAWITERKDVLSGFFGLLALTAYVWYSRGPSLLRYTATAAALVLGIMAKPMLVTWPLIFLLLDFWPLRRTLGPALLLEKLPLLALMAIVAVVAILGQQSGAAFYSLESAPLGQRLARAVEIYIAYLGESVWPANLTVLYPEAPLKSVIPAIAAGTALVLLTVGALWACRRTRSLPRPWLATGWLLYLITLLPVVGLVRVGSVIMADRFVYLPQIGLCTALAWEAADHARRRRSLRRPLAAAAALLLAALTLCAWRQTTSWRDSETLWKRSLACTRENYFAHNDLGLALAGRGKREAAIEHFRQALQINPEDAKARNNLGDVLAKQGQVPEAIDQFLEALRIKPDFAEAHNNLGAALLRTGRAGAAVEHFRKALAIRPDYFGAHNNLGVVLAKRGQFDKAIAEFRAALEIKPDNAEVRRNLDQALAGVR
jgi:tetratricopeptide (TPR) repeat protein